MLRRIILPILLAAFLGGFLSSAAEAKERIKGPGFRTHAPSGWVIDKQSSNGWRTVTITPPGHVMNMRDAVLISIAVTSVKRAEKATGVNIRDKVDMVKKLISIPSNAGGLDQSFAPQPTTLGHKKGIIFGVHYNYKGKGSAHNATLVRRGQKIYLLQVIMDEDLSDLGGDAASMVSNDWRWK